jgi:uncharacterized membrane protein YfcA
MKDYNTVDNDDLAIPDNDIEKDNDITQPDIGDEEKNKTKGCKYYFDMFFRNDQIKSKVKMYGKDEIIPFYVSHRKFVSFIIPIAVIYIIWWPYMIANDLFSKFAGLTGEHEKPRYLVSITMIFGSFIAGCTSEGGGAIAFPVLTLTMGILPVIARDFSFMIQSIGMVAAAFSIYFMQVQIEWKSIIYCSIGGLVGILYGLEYIAPLLLPAYTKMYFVCIWFSFAVSLFWLNYFHSSEVFNSIPHWDKGILYKKQLTNEIIINENMKIPKIEFIFNINAIILLCFGMLGGIFSALSGSGLDICSFAVLTLLYRVSERVATPTSVVLMAINTIVGFIYRTYSQGGVSEEAINLWLCCVPIVVIGAPLGAILSSHFHRSILSGLIYIIDSVQLIGALIIIKPWTTLKTDTPFNLCLMSSIILVTGGIFFTLVAYTGQYLKDKVKEWDIEKSLENKILDSESGVELNKNNE